MRRLPLFSFLFFLLQNSVCLVGEGSSGPVTMDTVSPEVMVTYPNGGENLYIGSSIDITWSASDFSLSPNPIYIYHRLTNGSEYNLLFDAELNDGICNWLLPSSVSEQNLIKIIAQDQFGNASADSSDAVFSISYVPPATPESLTIDTSNGIDAILNWAAVDTTIFGSPITVDGYFVLYNESAYEDSLQCYYFLAFTTETTYTHQHVAEFREQMYYQVIAYKDYDRKITDFLAEIKEKPAPKLSWDELKRRFR